jgi:hypothetical protein
LKDDRIVTISILAAGIIIAGWCAAASTSGWWQLGFGYIALFTAVTVIVVVVRDVV